MSSTRRRWSSASRTAPWTCGTQRSEYGSWTLWAWPWWLAWSPRLAQEVAELGGDGDLARMRPGELVGRGERDVRAEQRLDAHRRGDARRPRRAGRRRRASSAPIALISWVPLSSARPSLASSVERLEADLAQRDERRHDCPPSSTWPRPMSGSARWASGARSPDAPTVPCSGTTGWMPRAEERRAAGRRAAAGSRCGRARACSPGAGASPGRPRAGTARRRPRRGSSGGSPGAARASPGAIERVARSPNPVVTP